MNNPNKLQKKYDHVLIGYNLASISFAHHLANSNESFCLLDSIHFGNSPIKEISSIGQGIYARVPFNSFSEESVEGSVDNSPITFEKGEFKSFLGFGDSKIEAMDAVQPYCQPKAYVASANPESFWAEAKETIAEFTFLDQQLTDISFEENTLTSVTLNGKTQLQGGQFYFFDQFPFVIEKTGSQIKKLASQFAKAKWFSSTNLIIHHLNEPENFEMDQLYLLKGSKEQACLGFFSKINGELVSRWESFFPSELSADSETTGATLKEIKKQIKRAFSFPEGARDPEHILVQKQVYADLSKCDLNNGKLGNFNNLSLYSPLFDGLIGWYHERAIGESIAEDLFGPEKKSEVPSNEVAPPTTPC